MESPYKKRILEKKSAEGGNAGARKVSRKRRTIEFTAIAVLGLLACTLGYGFIHRMFISPPVAATVERTDSPVKKVSRIQVNIMNATPERELARTAMEFLRNRGFDVVELGNSSVSVRSYVVSRTADAQSARNVAFALGIPDSCVHSEADSSLFLDASVYIGGDYRSLKPWK